MVKSVSCCCVRGSRLFSDLVTFDEDISNAQALVALAIVLKSYPEQWREVGFFWDAWLAVTLQLCSLPAAGKILFPCIWIQQIFEAERYLKTPDNVKLLLFGMDPVSKTENYGREILCKATGIAFHGIRNDNASINGMKDPRGMTPLKIAYEISNHHDF